MPKVCATIATIDWEETKSLGIVLMRNFMPTACAKTAILISIIRNAGKKNKNLLLT
jgi:hypothetical protein